MSAENGPVPGGEAPADAARTVRLRRLHMRSIRRGIREMDLILGAFAVEDLPALGEAELETYEALLEESDHDLYAWVGGPSSAPGHYTRLMERIAERARLQAEASRMGSG